MSRPVGGPNVHSWDPSSKCLQHITATLNNQFSLSVVSDSVTPWTAARQPSLSITNSRSLLKFKSMDSFLSPLVFDLSQHQGLFQ